MTIKAQDITGLQRLYPGASFPPYGQAVELAAAAAGRADGTEAAGYIFALNASPGGREALARHYADAVAQYCGSWNGTGQPTVPERMAALILEERPGPADEPLPPGWNWPVCDDCTMPAHDLGYRTAPEQAAFMQEFGAELPDHLCEMGAAPEDRGRDACACGCQQAGR